MLLVQVQDLSASVEPLNTVHSRPHTFGTSFKEGITLGLSSPFRHSLYLYRTTLVSVSSIPF